MSGGRWYFTAVGHRVHLQARFESEDGDMVGDAYEELRPGESFHGLTYRQLQKARAGTVLVDDDGATIVHDEGSP